MALDGGGNHLWDHEWHVERPSASPLHPTMKPLPLIERAIELEPRYCDVIVARWEALTGLRAEKAT